MAYEEMEVNTSKQGKYYKMPNAHFHNAFEIYYLIAGTRKFFIDSEIYNISKGTLVLLERNVMHKTEYSSDKLGERTYVLFSDKYYNNMVNAFGSEAVGNCFKRKIFPIPRHRRGYIEGILRQLENEYKNKDEYSQSLMEIYMRELFIFLIRYDRSMGENDMPILSSGDEIIQSAARYITENYNKNISLSDVAEFVGMSSTYFSKKFKEVTGFGFKEYILNIRMKRACTLLLETRLSVTDIAYETGFNDSNYFGDVFRRMKGISPLKYRKNREYI